MENSLRFSPIGQLYPESMSDAKARFWQIGSAAVSRAEVICPQPRRVTSVSYILDNLHRFGPQSKGLPVRRGNHDLDIFDIILSKDELESSSDATNQVGFLCGSPPVRTNNPVINDAEFAKMILVSSFSPRENSHEVKPESRKKGCPLCSSSTVGLSPKVRVEGFACGSPESPCVVSAIV